MKLYLGSQSFVETREFISRFLRAPNEVCRFVVKEKVGPLENSQEKIGTLWQLLIHTCWSKETQGLYKATLEELNLGWDDQRGFSVIDRVIKEISRRVLSSSNGKIVISPKLSDSSPDYQPGVFFVRTKEEDRGNVLNFYRSDSLRDLEDSETESSEEGEDSSSSSDGLDVCVRDDDEYSVDESSDDESSDSSSSEESRKGTSSVFQVSRKIGSSNYYVEEDESSDEASSDSSETESSSESSSDSSASSESSESECLNEDWEPAIPEEKAINPMTIAVGKVGHRRLLEVHLGRIAHFLGLRDHIVPSLPCAFELEPMGTEDKLISSLLKHKEIDTELFNNNLKVFLPPISGYSLDAQGWIGVLQAFCSTSQPAEILDFAKMTLLAGVLGLRDAKEDGYIGSELIDVDYALPPNLDLVPGQEINKTTPSTHIPFLTRSKNWRQPLDSSVRAALYDLVLSWDENRVEQIQEYLDSLVLEHVEEDLEAAEENSKHEDSFGMRVRIENPSAGSYKLKGINGHPRYGAKKGDPIFESQQIENLLERIRRAREFVVLMETIEYSLFDLIGAIDPLWKAWINSTWKTREFSVDTKKALIGGGRKEEEKVWKEKELDQSQVADNVGLFGFLDKEERGSPVVRELEDNFSEGLRAIQERRSISAATPGSPAAGVRLSPLVIRSRSTSFKMWKTGTPKDQGGSLSPTSPGRESSNSSDRTDLGSVERLEMSSLASTGLSPSISPSPVSVKKQLRFDGSPLQFGESTLNLIHPAQVIGRISSPEIEALRSPEGYPSN